MPKVSKPKPMRVEIVDITLREKNNKKWDADKGEWVGGSYKTFKPGTIVDIQDEARAKQLIGTYTTHGIQHIRAAKGRTTTLEAKLKSNAADAEKVNAAVAEQNEALAQRDKEIADKDAELVAAKENAKAALSKSTETIKALSLDELKMMAKIAGLDEKAVKATKEDNRDKLEALLIQAEAEKLGIAGA